MVEERLLPSRESLTVEFKSDHPAIYDNDLLAVVVCLANAEGGDFYLGVENDGTVTGLSSQHRDVAGLAAMIANRSIPPLSVRVSALPIRDKVVALIEVPRSRRIVATSSGLVQQRRMGSDGKPQCMPMYPHEYDRREADLGLLDVSARPVDGAAMDDFDPLERQRLRQAIQRYGGDAGLLALNDEELDGALGLAKRIDDRRVPTLGGLLMLGRESALRQHLPTHEVAFQMLDGTQVRVNDFFHAPVLRTFELVEERFNARIEEQEVQIGMFRVPVPSFDRRAFREALANAVIHRDYTRIGAIHARWQVERPDAPGEIILSNPGGFVDGVTLENLLVTEPRPRNPLLADAFKRIGLVERTGRGVDIIFQGMLRFGRPAPDYRRSDRNSVVVRMIGGAADLRFLEMVLAEENRTQAPLPVDSLLALHWLRDNSRLTIAELAPLIQKGEAEVRWVLERLVGAGLAQARGTGRGRNYQLSAAAHRRLGTPAAYGHQSGFEPLQQEQMVLRYALEHGRITRRQVADLCMIGSDQAKRLLARLATEGRLNRRGTRGGAFYVPV